MLSLRGQKPEKKKHHEWAQLLSVCSGLTGSVGILFCFVVLSQAATEPLREARREEETPQRR